MEAITQVNMLQPKKLNSLNSLNNCVIAEGSPFGCNRQSSSYSHERGLSRNAQTLIFYKNSELFSSEYDWDKSFELERFKEHLCYQKPKQFFKKVCENCKADYETDEKGKPISYRWTCGSPYCKDEECFKQRYSVVRDYFMIFFNAYPSWTTKRGNRWIHEVFGFKRQQLPTRKELTLMRATISKFLKASEKEFSIRIKGIGVRDLAYDIEKIGEEYYIHFHFARRPTRFVKKADFNKLGKKFNLKYVYNGYRKAYWLADYFAKRHSGQFGHKKDNSNWKFPDIMDIETYFKLFHKSRKSFYFGFTRREVRFLKKRAEELHKCEAFVLSSNVLPTAKPTECSKCGCKSFIFVPIEEKEEKPPDPPPESPITIEYIKIA